jgi:hypothetical protein
LKEEQSKKINEEKVWVSSLKEYSLKEMCRKLEGSRLYSFRGRLVDLNAKDFYTLYVEVDRWATL